MKDLMMQWYRDQHDMRWHMPTAPRWKKLPVVRHIRAIYHAIAFGYHDHFYNKLGLASSGYDEWVLFGMWMGKER